MSSKGQESGCYRSSRAKYLDGKEKLHKVKIGARLGVGWRQENRKEEGNNTWHTMDTQKMSIKKGNFIIIVKNNELRYFREGEHWERKNKGDRPGDRENIQVDLDIHWLWEVCEEYRKGSGDSQTSGWSDSWCIPSIWRLRYLGLGQFSKHSINTDYF